MIETRIHTHLLRLQYGYFICSKTMWTKMHGYFRITHNLLLGIHQRTRIKLIQNIAFGLAFEVFKLCNFCFEKHYLLVTRTDGITKRETFSLEGD
ncbi:Uncharacterised protein [Klebsiella oxytoca]|nr:Uncharacterised protein [Klebsiella oxytoca]